MPSVSPERFDAIHTTGVNDVPNDKISAYYSLVFPNITYYLQTLTVTIGRRCLPNSNAAVASSSDSSQTQVDVDLGPLKSVSRLHAKIEYQEEEERFVLVVIGRNGAWVDGVWSGRGSKVALSER
jgi:forkhead box protein K